MGTRMKQFRLRLVWLAFLTALLAACSASGPEAFTKHYYATISEGETEQILELFSYKDMEQAQMTAARGKVTMMVGMMQAGVKTAGGIEEVEIVKVNQTDDDHATVDHILHMGDGTSSEETLNLVRVDGEWKVALF